MADFAVVAAAALARAEALLRAWLPEGRRRGHEWVCGSLRGEAGDSCSTNIDTGQGADFATGQTWGDLVSLYAHIHGLSQGHSCADLARQFGLPNGSAGAALLPRARAPTAVPASSADPIPPGTPDPGPHPVHGAHSALHRYGDAFVVARYDLPQGKQFCQYTWRAGRWQPKAYPAPRPLYGLAALTETPAAPVLVVEGEKCADAARAALPAYAVVSWAGGAQAVKTADWSVLAGRCVDIWPDADEPGRQAAAALAAALAPLAGRVRVVDPAGQPEGWDIADAIAEGWSGGQLTAWARARLKGLQSVAPPNAAPSAPPPNSAVVSWQSFGLEVNQGGVPHATLANAALVLGGHPEFSQRLWFDEFRGKIMYDARPWTDADDLEVTAFLQQRLRLAKFGLQVVSQAVILVAHRNRRNSLTTWLSSLSWDGTERLAHWLADYLGCPKTPYTQAVARNWLVSMVARAFKPGCQADHMPVLEGTQGRGKSTALAILGGEWYRAAPQAFGSKEFFEVIQGAWLIEIPDMVGFGRREHSQIISAITTRSDSYRASYGRHAEEHPRGGIFAATSETDEYLQDSRGIRRYWPLRCAEIELTALGAVRDQLFAEAVAAFKGGASWHEMPEEETAQQQLQRQERDIWFEHIEGFVRNKPETFVTDVAELGLGIETARLTRSEQMRIAKCLKELGYERAIERFGADVRRVYRKAAAAAVTTVSFRGANS